MHWFHHGSTHDELPDALRDTPLGRYVNGSISLEQALDSFCRPVEDKFMNTSKSEAVDSLLLEAWKSVIATASAITYTSGNRQKLADFVVALQYRPTLMKGEHVCQLNGGKVWKDLPEFGMQMREAWNMAATANSDEIHQIAWINLNAFVATLTASSEKRKLEPSDFSLYCIWTVRDALEQQDGASEIAVQTAAVWFICAAPAIWTFCRLEKAFEGKLARPGTEFASREWKGFDKDRWTSWEARLRNIVKNPDLQEKTKKLVNDALAAMRAVG